jgi:hypothetical protein
MPSQTTDQQYGTVSPKTSWSEKSAEAIVCAGQRKNQEGSSPSGARMRGVVSKGGGNASSASGFSLEDRVSGVIRDGAIFSSVRSWV